MEKKTRGERSPGWLSRRAYPILRWTARRFYPPFRTVGAENLPEGPCVVVGNHAHGYGPIICELDFPRERCTWGVGELMSLGEAPDYVYRDFWPRKPLLLGWWYRLLSYLLAPVLVCSFHNANVIAVYRDARVLGTFRETVRRLREGACVVIFPECPTPRNNIIWEFQDRFIDVARLYRRATGKDLAFVPMYVAPALRALYLGQPVSWDASAPPEQERRRVCRTLMDRITELARALPEHTVVPYPNIPRREYPSNRDFGTSGNSNQPH